MPNLIGKDIGRYHIVEELGKGGMAYVYKAYDNRLDRFVALKVISSSQEDQTTFLKRFDREAKALARLSHPHIVKVHDYGDENDTPYLVMELLEGGSLREKMGAAMPFVEAARLLIPICQALQYAHQMKIIHRDVKPANILLTKNGIPMLTDFGIAKIVSANDSTELTGAGFGIGTADYMSPEQGQALNIDSRTDIYSLGVVFYELVTGINPFHADTPMATILKHINEPLPRPRLYNANLPVEVENITFKAMAKNPDHRYQSMTEFSAALEKLVASYSYPEKTSSPYADVETIVYGEIQSTRPIDQRQESPDSTKPMPDEAETFATPEHLKTTMASPQYQVSTPSNLAGQGSFSMPIDTAIPDRQGSGSSTRLRILRIALIFLVSIFLISCIFVVGASFFLSKTAKDTVAASEFISFSQQTEQSLSETEADTILSEAIGSFSMYISSLAVDFQSPDTILFTAQTSLGRYSLDIQTVKVGQEHRLVLRKINNIPLFVVGNIISNGINSGLTEALDKYHLKLEDLTISNDSVTYKVSPSGQ